MVRWIRHPGLASPPAASPAVLPAALPAASPERLRGIEELLSVPFITLNAQEKIRVLLPLLRGMDPRLLEQNLGELRSVQAKGPGHEKVVATAILNSPNDEAADNIFASELTRGHVHNTNNTLNTASTANTPTTPRQQVTSGARVSVRETSPLAHKSTGAETECQLGATRQLEALKKAAVLRSLGRRR